eukprot:s20_g5.t2
MATCLCHLGAVGLPFVREPALLLRAGADCREGEPEPAPATQGNVMSFGITQAQALKKDPTLTATSCGYISEEFTLGAASVDSFIPGLIYLPNFLTIEEEQGILASVDAAGWDGDNKSRRTQQYGYGFHWRNRHTNALAKLDPPRSEMPPFSQAVLHRLVSEGHLESPDFDQCIVNDYTGGQGIKAHRDREFFGEAVVGFSLRSPTIMDFRMHDGPGSMPSHPHQRCYGAVQHCLEGTARLCPPRLCQSTQANPSEAYKVTVIKRYESDAVKQKAAQELGALQAQLQEAQGKLNPLKNVRQDFVQRTAAQKVVQEVLEKLSPAEVDVDRAEEATEMLKTESTSKEF